MRDARNIRGTDVSLDSLSTLPKSAACMNPSCRESVTHNDNHSGRQPLFCSSRCRLDYWHTRERLAGVHTAINVALQQPGRLQPTRRELRQRLKHIDWLLARYPKLG